TMQLSFKFHGNTMTWPEQPMEGIVMGMVGIPGSSFVTDGPSKVDFVLNDPPGSNSFAYIDKGSSMTLGVSNGLTFGDVTGDESQWAVGADVATLTGMGIMTKSNVTKKLVGTLQKDASFDLMTFSDKKSMTYTFNQRIQTSSSPDFVGANGDVYIGRATNYFFTDTRYTNMTTEAERVVPALDKEMYCVESENYVQRGDTLLGGTKFYLTNWLQPIGGTTNESVFSFTQKHIVTELIPDLRKRRAQLVTYDPAYAQKKSADMPVLPEGECRYFAKRPLDQMDDNMDVWRRDTDYVFQHTAKDKFDKVALYSNAIAKWKSTIAANERNKAYNLYKLDGQTKGKYKQSSLIRNISPEMIAEKYALNLRDGIIAMDAVTGALNMANNVVKLVDLMGKVKDFGRITSSVFNPFAIASQALATVWEVAYTVVKNTETQDAKMTQNLHYIDSNTFDAGMTMSNSMTTSQTYTTTRAFSDQHDIQFGGVDNSELAVMGASTQESAKSWAGFRYGSTKNVDAASTGTTTFGYTLSTSGASTYESVDIYLPISPDAKIGDDGEVTGNTSMPYMFYLRGGQSKVPWEKPDSTLYFKQTESFKTSTGKAGDAFPLSDGTVALVIPEFDMPSEFAMLPAGEKSNIEATLRNVSVATFSPTVSETAPKLVFGIDPKTNQHGLQFDRGVMTGQYAVGLKPQTSTKLSFTVQQTRTDVTRDTVTFILYPDGDLGRAVRKPVIFNFVPMASPVTLETDRVTVNGEAIEGKQAAREIGVTLSNYHMEYKNFAGVVIQTRLVGTNAWKPIYLFYIDKDKYDLEKDWKGANVKLQAGKSFATITLGDQFTDGDYEIRAVAQSKASREDAGLETASEALRFSLDTKKPMVMGKPTGELLYGENLQLTFDEDIRYERVTTDNFTIVTDLDAQVAREHAVAMKFYECGPAETKHEFSLFGYRDFTLAMKFKPISTKREAVLFSQMGQVGDFRVSYDSARVYVKYGDKVMASPIQALDATGGYNSDWMQLVVTYRQDEDTTDGTISSMLYTTNDEYAGPAMTLNAIPKTQAILRMGADAGRTNGNVLMHDVMLWDGIVSKEEMEANLENALIGLDKRIIAYWPANEGRGTVVTDLRFDRNLVMPDGAEWYSRIPNYSLALDGSQAFRIPTQKVVFSPQESYGLSFWFKSTAAGQNATLCSLDNGTAVNAFTIGAGGEVTAEFAGGGLSIAKVTPNVWHNLFMEYVGGGYTRFYLDGEVVREVESTRIPRFAFDTMTMGGRTVYQDADTTRRVTDFFKGGIDDVRVQQGRFTQNIITDAVNRCLTGREEGLKIYYPFQRIRKLDDPVVAEPCGYNHILQVKDGDEYIDESDRGAIIGAAAIADVVEQDDAPMQKSASFRRPLAGKTEYSVIASEREVLINISEDVARRLEGKTLHITALGIQDVHENTMTPYTWDVIVHQDWGTWVPSLLDLTLPVDTVAEIETGLVKYSRMGSLHLSELADWMSVRTMTDEGFYYFVVYLVDTRHLSPGVYYAQVSLSNHEGAAIPQTIKLTVKGKDPGWKVDPSRFNANMNLIADLHLNDRLWVSEDARVAAFIDGECRGVGQLKYNENTNRSLLYLTIFGNDMAKGGDKGKTVTFKAWDPNKGVIYNALRVKDGDSRDVANVTFDSSVLCGAYDRPWHLIAVDVVQHDVPLTSGWNWVSTYVEAVTPKASDLLADVQGHISMVKDRTLAAVPGSAAMGRITIRPNSMYMIHVKTDDPIDRLSISGEKAVSEETIITVPGSKTGWAWGWIGYPCQRTMTLRQALSFLNPHKNDIIKSQTEFAVYDGQDWQGTLGYLRPGRGYMYGNSLGTGETLEFHFPADIGAATQAPAAPTADNPRGMTASGQASASGEGSTDYPHNMVVIGQTLPGAKVCAFVNGEQRTESVADADGRVYLTVGGEGAMGSLTFVIVDTDDNSRAATTRLQYADDRVDGTVETPVLLLPAATDGHADDAVYDLAGRYMGRFADLRRLAPAVYIMNGLKFNTQR
ncbi:MAG: hypothetical protein HUK01_03055, partial [Bacteroidaceae bacterium]|nr:hypothetical protein [Bacteroidaceae bacterium]